MLTILEQTSSFTDKAEKNSHFCSCLVFSSWVRFGIKGNSVCETESAPKYQSEILIPVPKRNTPAQMGKPQPDIQITSAQITFKVAAFFFYH